MFNNKIILGLISAYVLLSLSSLYFFFFPTIISPLTSDVFIGSGMLLVFLILTYASFKAESSRDIALVLFGVVISGILMRSIPHLRIAYPILKDPLLYAVSAINIMEYGTLESHLMGWYSGTASHLSFPTMHLIAAMTSKLSGLDIMWFLRFQEPLLGGLGALITFAFAREVTRNNSIALITALLVTISDVIAFYQAEYQPQGLAFLLFILFLYLYLKSMSLQIVGFRFLYVVVLMGLILSHHFSSVFISLLSIGFLGINLLTIFIPELKKVKYTGPILQLKNDYLLWIIVAVIGLSYGLMIARAPIPSFLRDIKGTSPVGASLFTHSTRTIQIPSLIILGNLTKWVIFSLGAYHVIKIIRNPRIHESRILIIIFFTLMAGLISNYVIFGPLDRIIAFYTPLISVLAATALYEFYRFKIPDFIPIILKIPIARLPRRPLIPAILLVICSLLWINFFNFNFAALYFKTSEANPVYWYDNIPPPMEYHKAAGEWFGRNTNRGKITNVEWDTQMGIFFFGRVPIGEVQMYLSYPFKFDYSVVNPTLNLKRYDYSKSQLDQSASSIYTNRSIVVYYKAVIP